MYQSSQRVSPAPAALVFLVVSALVATACATTTGVNSKPPEVTITAPVSNARFEQSDTITFEGSAVDPEDGPLTGVALTWKSDIDGTLGSGEQFVIAASNLSSGDHTITLAATDSDGVTGSASVPLVVVRPPS